MSLSVGSFVQHYTGDHTEGVNNRLLALEYDGWVGAWFRNSYGNETGFLAHGWHTEKWELGKDWWVRGNFYAGILLGYNRGHSIRLGVFSPGAYPTASIGYKRYSFEGGVMPTFWWVGAKVEF